MADERLGRPSITIAGRLETVWELLTSEAGSSRWLGTKASGGLRAGAPIHVGGRDGRVKQIRPDDHVVVLAWPENREVTLSFTPREITGSRAHLVVRIDVAGRRALLRVHHGPCHR